MLLRSSRCLNFIQDHDSLGEAALDGIFDILMLCVKSHGSSIAPLIVSVVEAFLADDKAGAY